MSLFTSLKKKDHLTDSKSQYIITENEPTNDDTKPSEQPVNPDKTEVK